jgi:arylsulfatase A-like enzyme
VESVLEPDFTLNRSALNSAAVMTGRYPWRYGLQTIVIPSKGTYGLSFEERTLPEILRDTGYRTSMIGKWHLGHADRNFWPRQRGFDYH